MLYSLLNVMKGSIVRLIYSDLRNSTDFTHRSHLPGCSEVLVTFIWEAFSLSNNSVSCVEFKVLNEVKIPLFQTCRQLCSQHTRSPKTALITSTESENKSVLVLTGHVDANANRPKSTGLRKQPDLRGCGAEFISRRKQGVYAPMIELYLKR